MNLKWETPLTQGILLKRYKRFLADIKLDEELITAHVPNTGSMLSCWEPDWKCAVSVSSNPSRKMAHTLELTHNGTSWIGVNTANANKLVKNWLTEGLIPELAGYEVLQAEKKVGESRVDFYLENHPTHSPCYVEVKSVTLKLDGVAQFPDSVSERGQKHLRELMALKNQGYRAAMLYVVQREDVEAMRVAEKLDPEYARLLKEAVKAGVEVLVYQCRLGVTQIQLGNKLPFIGD
jgi:sugar fermentation stimulation protein A